MREVPLVMPKMSMTMTEGTFIEWHLKEGDEVKAGDVVCEVASDKVDMEVESPVEGVLSRLVATPDAVVAVGDPLAFISSDADDMLEGLFDGAPSDEPDEKPAEASDNQTKPASHTAASASSPPSRRGPRPAVPRARRRASELRLDIEKVVGSGPDGLITLADVERAGKAPTEAPETPASPASGPTASSVQTPVSEASEAEFAATCAAFGATDIEPLSRINRMSGQALSRAWGSVPHVTHHDRADITDLDPYRRELDGEARSEGYRVTLLAFVLKACASALKAHPRVNSSLSPNGSSLVLKRYYNIGVAVDTDDGLVVPVISDVDRKGIKELSQDLAAVSARAREGKLTAEDVSGASFSVSSLGGIGGTGFTPIVNAPEAAILGISRSNTEPVWDGEQFAPRLVLPLSLSYDHRIIDGALAARFTARLSHLLGDVRRLVL